MRDPITITCNYNTSSLFELENDLNGWWYRSEPETNNRTLRSIHHFNFQIYFISDGPSTCSKEATEIGVGQKVISYSLFVSTQEAVPYFFDGIVPNLEKLRAIYPGWLVRIYTNVPVNDHSCFFICRNDHLFWCNIADIPELGKTKKIKFVNGFCCSVKRKMSFQVIYRLLMVACGDFYL